MKPYLIIWLCLTLFYSFSLNALDKDNLWSKAQTIAEANLNLIPGKTHMTMTTVNDRSGDVIQNSEVKIKHFLNEKSEIVSKILQQDVEGENELDQENDRMINNMLERDLKPKREGIFFLEPNDDFKLKPTGEKSSIKGFDCLEFEFSFNTKTDDDKEVTFVGSLWLEEETGAVIKQVFSSDRTPMFVRDITIERSYFFDKDKQIWYLEEMTTKAEVRLLLRRLTNQSRTVYKDYWEYPYSE